MAARLVRSEQGVKVWSLIGSGDSRRVEAMLKLYAELFPLYAHYLPRMRRRAEFAEEHRTGHLVHYWLAEVDDQPAAIRSFRYVHGRHVGLAHALAVDPEFREVKVSGQRLSMFLVQECLAQIMEDAALLNGGPALGMVNEVDSERLMEHYARNGIIRLPVAYSEPIFPAEARGRTRDEEVEMIHFAARRLGFLPNPQSGVTTYSGELTTNFVLAFLVDHYGLPMSHPQVQAALNSIPVSL